MLLRHINIENFFLFSLPIWFFIGYSGFLNTLLILQFTLIFFFLDFKINYVKFIINIVVISLFIFLSENLNAIKIYFIFLIFIFSFDFKNKIKNNIKAGGYYFFVILLLLIYLFKHSPHTTNHAIKYKLKVENIIEFHKKNYEKFISEEGIVYYAEILKKRNPIYSNNLVIPDVCKDNNNLFDKNLCSKNYDYLENRFTINSVDVNFFSVILLSLLFISLLSINKKDKFLLATYIILGIAVLFLTKSRAGLIFLLMSLIILFFNNLNIKKILLVFILLHFAIIFVGYLMVNSVSDPMMMSSPKISDNGLINFPINKGYGTVQLFRLFHAFDSSNFIRFSSFFQAFLIYVNEFNIILFPDHTNLVSEINYKTYVGEKFIIKSSDYDPHNFTMGMIKELGLLATIYFYIFLFNFLKHDRFKVLIFPILFSSIFLGIGIIYIIPTILVFSCVPKNNFINIINKLKT